MRSKKQSENHRYVPSNRPSSIFHQLHEKDLSLNDNRYASDDIRQQLRLCLQELEHHRLTSDLQIQKRLLLEQQLKTLRHQYQQQRQEKDQLKKDLAKLSKKYGKVKQKKQCEKCKNFTDISEKLQKEREIYLNDRKILQDQIKILKNQLQNSQVLQERQNLLVLTDSLKKQIYLGNKKIEQQTRVIQFMNEKLTVFQIENVQIMNNVELLQNKLSQIEIDKVINKKQNRPCPHCSVKPKGKEDSYSNHSPLTKKRRNGSIQNIKRGQRDEGYEQLQRYDD